MQETASDRSAARAVGGEPAGDTPSSSAPSPGAGAPPPRRRGGASRALEWLFGSDAIARERAAIARLGPRPAPFARAKNAAELAGRVLDPIEPLRQGDGSLLAVSLYREAAYWALVSDPATPEPAPGFAAAFDAAPDVVADAALARAARRALVERSFVETAALPADELRRDVEAARSFVGALFARLEGGRERLGGLLALRAARLVAALAILVFVAGGAARIANQLFAPRNLAAGHPWRTSSTYGGFAPADHRVDGNQSSIFFHTDQDVSPWVEFDLGAPQPVKALKVVNRSDCCSERAIPLVFEVSNDQSQWREIARRPQTFSVWQQSFEPTTARYLRLRSDRRTWLHLERAEFY